jgi:hypothetical protein
MKDGCFSRDGATNIKGAGHTSSFDQIVEDQQQVKAHVFCVTVTNDNKLDFSRIYSID